MRTTSAVLAGVAAILGSVGAALAQAAPGYQEVRFVLMRDVVTDPAWRPYLPEFTPNPGPEDYIALADIDLVPGNEIITTSWVFGLCGSIGCSVSATWTDGTRFAQLIDWDVNDVKWGPVLYLRDEAYKGLRTGHSDFDQPNMARGPDKKADFVRGKQVAADVLEPIAKFLATESTVLPGMLPNALVAIMDFDGDGNPHNDDVFLSFFCERVPVVLL